MSWRYRVILAWFACFCVPAAWSADYKVGERLHGANTAAQGEYKEIDWDALIPPSSLQKKMLKDLNLGDLEDDDPRAVRALEEIREAWGRAPTNPALNGLKARIAGFVIPLEKNGEIVTEFLLVPYFGACIHTPPPAQNQLIHVRILNPSLGLKMMDPVWVSGKLSVESVKTGMGAAGYQMRAEKVSYFYERR